MYKMKMANSYISGDPLTFLYDPELIETAS